MPPRSRNGPGSTPCKNHMMLSSEKPTASMHNHTYSDCEYHGTPCRYSHNIFNLKRVLKLGTGIIRLNYGHGSERYGNHECGNRGWSITLNAVPICFYAQNTKDLPKSILLAEENRGITRVGTAEVSYEKKQSLCQAHQSGNCTFGSQCRLDHDLIDGKRLENLVRWGLDDSGTYEYLTVECRNSPRGSVRWKITLKPDAFKALKADDPVAKTLPARLFSREGDDLLQVIREMEKIVGIDSSLDTSGPEPSSNTSDASQQPKSSANAPKSSTDSSTTKASSTANGTQSMPAKSSQKTPAPIKTSLRHQPKSAVDVPKPSITSSSIPKTSDTVHRTQPPAKNFSSGVGPRTNPGRVNTSIPPWSHYALLTSGTTSASFHPGERRTPVNSPATKKGGWGCYIS